MEVRRSRRKSNGVLLKTSGSPAASPCCGTSSRCRRSRQKVAADVAWATSMVRGPFRRARVGAGGRPFGVPLGESAFGDVREPEAGGEERPGNALQAVDVATGHARRSVDQHVSGARAGVPPAGCDVGPSDAADAVKSLYSKDSSL